jgi:hypothetical protein
LQPDYPCFSFLLEDHDTVEDAQIRIVRNLAVYSEDVIEAQMAGGAAEFP